MTKAISALIPTSAAAKLKIQVSVLAANVETPSVLSLVNAHLTTLTFQEAVVALTFDRVTATLRPNTESAQILLDPIPDEPSAAVLELALDGPRSKIPLKTLAKFALLSDLLNTSNFALTVLVLSPIAFGSFQRTSTSAPPWPALARAATVETWMEATTVIAQKVTSLIAPAGIVSTLMNAPVTRTLVELVSASIS